MFHNARTVLTNRHFQTMSSNQSIILSSLDGRYVNCRECIVRSKREIIRTFSRESVDFRGHIVVDDPRIAFDRVAAIDESTMLPARRPDVHETFISLHSCDGSPHAADYKIARKITVAFPPCRAESPSGHSRVIFTLWYFSIGCCLRERRRVFG